MKRRIEIPAIIVTRTGIITHKDRIKNTLFFVLMSLFMKKIRVLELPLGNRI